MSERKEAFMRIIVGIVTGVILGIWAYLIYALVFVNFIVTIFTGKRVKDLAKFSEIWNTQSYTFVRYMTFVSNQRPMPFKPLAESISKFK